MSNDRMKLKNAWPYVKRAWRAAKKQSILTDRSHLDLFFDMMLCKFRYRNSVNDYLLFNFMERTSREERDNYIYVREWNKIVASLNPAFTDMKHIKNKVSGFKRYKKYFRRDVLIVAEASDEEIKAFLEKHGTIFAKIARSGEGKGVEKIFYDPSTADSTVAYLREKYDMLEEEIKQHPLLESISPRAVATVRITVLKHDGKIHQFPASIRISTRDDLHFIRVGESAACALDENGTIVSPGIVNDFDFDPAEETAYDTHPMTGVPLSDGTFQVPYYREMIDMLMEIMEAENDYGYLGWDFTATEEGPCVIEVNPWGYYDFYQYDDHVKRIGHGARPTVEAFLGCKIEDLPKKADRIAKAKSG